MARPAASSFAEFMRDPVDNRCIAISIDLSFFAIAFWAIIDDVFVLITVITLTSMPSRS